MTSSKNWLPTLLILSFSLILSPLSCAKPSKEILGTWKLMATEYGDKQMTLPPELQAKWTFKSDGSVLQTKIKKTLVGKWVLRKGKLGLMMPKAKKQTMAYKIEKKSLMLSFDPPEKITLIFERMPGG